MSSRTRNRWKHLQRAGWTLWVLTFALLLALAATVPALYAPLLQMADKSGRALDDVWFASVTLCGLVLLFCLYTVLQQRELNRAMRALGAEEREREDVAARLGELSSLFQVSTTLQLQLRADVV